MKHNVLRFLYIGFVCCVVSCTGDKVYDRYNHTPIMGWEKVDTLKFEVPKFSQRGRYSTNLGLRIDNHYPFMSLTLIVEQTVYPGARTHVDTLHCSLVDEKGGMKGQGVGSYQYHFRVSEMNLKANDSLHICVRHDMKREIMPGISDVGIEISRLY